EELARNTSYAQSMDVVLRAVKEGSFRASTDEGQRMLENISTSIDRAHQEQEIASSQFQQAQSYREVASMSREAADTINTNATQAFMEQLQHSGKNMREVEEMMVRHPEQAQAMADGFVQEKAREYIEKYPYQSHADSKKKDKN